MTFSMINSSFLGNYTMQAIEQNVCVVVELYNCISIQCPFLNKTQLLEY